LGNEFFGKEGVKPREEKPVEKPSGEKPSDYCGRDGNKDEFFSRGSVRREWQWSGLTRTSTTPSNGVLEPRMQMPRAKVIVRTVPTWEDRKVAS
jgi:hypothetical protein